MGSTSRRRRRSPSSSAASATFGSRGTGVVAGLAVAAAVIEVVCGDAASEFAYVVADGDRVGPGTEVAPGDGADPAPADGRAKCAEPAVPPVGNRHAHAPLGRRAGGHPGPRPGHPQDDTRAAGVGEVRGSVRGRRQPPHGPVRHGARQGQPRRRRRGSGCRVRAGPCARSDDPRRDRGRHARRAPGGDRSRC